LIAETLMLPSNTNSSPDFMVFTGNANPVLAAEVAYELDVSLGLADVGRFSDGEVTVELKQTFAHAMCLSFNPLVRPPTKTSWNC
jgi:hypothetical protein